MDTLISLLTKNGFVFALCITGIILYLANLVSTHLFKNKIPGAAIAIITGLVLAYIGGTISNGKAGISDIPIFSGFSLLGGSMLRDFTIVATALGASMAVIRKTGMAGVLSLLLGVVVTFIAGAVIAYAMGYHDAASITTIGAGACTFIVGPVTGTAVGASSDVIALSIAAGVVKSILVTIGTPMVAKYIGLTNPHTAMVYGGMMGTTSGVAAGLAATDIKLVPYGALTATFYTGLGCLLCPSILFILVKLWTD
jgi:malonate transporter MadM subunit